MVTGLLVIASTDIASAMTRAYRSFLGLRALAGMGWAMFGTVATTAMVDQPGARRRGRAISLLLMTETLGLLLGSAAGGWLYQGGGTDQPVLLRSGLHARGRSCGGTAAGGRAGGPPGAASRRIRPAPSVECPPRARGAADESDQRGVDGDPGRGNRLPVSALPRRARTLAPRDRRLPGQPRRARGVSGRSGSGAARPTGGVGCRS